MFSVQKLSEGLDHDSEFSYSKHKGNCVMGEDIAFSPEVTADWTVTVVANQLEGSYDVVQHIDGNENHKIVEQPIFIERILRYHGINNLLTKEMYDVYECSKNILDKSTGGVLVAKDLRATGMNIEEQSFDSASRKMLLLNLWKIIDQGRLIFPYKENGNSEQVVKQLLYELKGMQNSKTRNDTETFESTTKHDDCVMALALAVKDFSRRVNYSDNMIFSANKDGTTNDSRNKPKNNEMHSSKVVPFQWAPA
jgi:phage terminase large subunit-like protein